MATDIHAKIAVVGLARANPSFNRLLDLFRSACPGQFTVSAILKSWAILSLRDHGTLLNE